MAFAIWDCMATFTSHSPNETLELGVLWGQAAGPGWVFGLIGDLGSGKTRLAQGIALGLGIKAPVQSPTFTLVHEYTEGRCPLFHLDLYRLDTPAAILGAGLDDYFWPRHGVTVVEWVERWLETLGGATPAAVPGGRFRLVHLEVSAESVRCIRYEDTRA